jgi:DNA-directed RNA polymerase I subunit RPA43
MSIEMPSQITEPVMESSQLTEKSHKKHKSSHEKKRKRDHEDGRKSKKSKKHKPDKTASQSSLPEPPTESSPFHLQTSTLYLPLAPISQSTPVEGLCAEHLSPLLLTYYPPFNGVVLSYHNPRLSEKPYGNDGPKVLLHNIDEYAVSWCWVTAEFLVFKPVHGAWLEGYVNLQNESHLGVVCWNLFNASLTRDRLPEDWKWVGVEELSTSGVEGMGETYAEDGHGYFVDGDGKKIEGMVRFRVRETDSSHDRERGFLSIEGTMLDEEAEERLTAVEREQELSREGERTKSAGAKALGATNLAVPKEVDLMAADSPKKKKGKY